MEVFKESSRFKVQVSELGNIIGIRGYVLKPLPYGKKGYSKYYGVDVVNKVTGKLHKGYPIHRLVAECFLPSWSAELQVNHIDGNKANNRLENLEWCTDSENKIHAYKNGLMVGGNQYSKHKIKNNLPRYK